MFTTVPDKAAGDVFEELMWDTYIRDNLNKGVWRPIGHAYAAAGAAASFDFTAIAGDWRHLLIVYRIRGTSGSNTDALLMRLNGSSTASYHNQRLQGAGATASAVENLANTAFIAGYVPGVTTGGWGVGVIWIPDYAATGLVHGFASLWHAGYNNSTGTLLTAISGGWGGGVTVPVTQVTLTAGANIAQYSTATLYAAAEV